MWLALANLLGGIGLFAVGIHLTSEGFQNAAGSSLRRILADYTDSTFKGISSGCFVAALIQSSSAVIVTLIGFINARLIKLKQAITIVFGANLGKVLTIWILATLGFKFDLAAYGLYIVGVAALLQSVFFKKKSGWTIALMGFGLLLFGLDTLKNSIAGLGPSMEWQALAHPGLVGMLIYFLLGTAMAIVMQSSTAAIVITFSALNASLINIENATALVIGQNLGAISSSILASMGTTQTAKRLSAVHVLFNVVVTLVSLVLLSGLILFDKHKLFVSHQVITVTVFYSVAIAITLAILMPLRNKLVKFLSKYFVDSKGLGSPLFIKSEKTESPDTALLALREEIWHFATLSTQVLHQAIQWRFKHGWIESVDLSYEEREMDRLVDDIHWFATKAARKQQQHAHLTPIYYGLSMAARHFENVCDTGKKITSLKGKFNEKMEPSVLADIVTFTESLMSFIDLLSHVRDQSDGFLFPEIEEFLNVAQTQKETLQQNLLKASTARNILYSDAILLMEISDLALDAAFELYRGTRETVEKLQMAFSASLPENVIPIKTTLIPQKIS